MLDDVKRAYQEQESKFQQRVGARDALNKKLSTINNEISELSERMATTEKAVHLLQAYSNDQQAILSDRIEGIVTAGIRAVFQDPTLSFKLTYSETKKGTAKKTPEIKMSVEYISDGIKAEGSLKNSFGGGLAAVVAVLLNLAVVLHLHPRVRPIVVWDEPLGALSPATPGLDSVAQGYRERMADFLRSVVDETDIQVILVSHEPDYSEVADVSHHLNGGIGKIPKVVTSKPLEMKANR